MAMLKKNWFMLGLALALTIGIAGAERLSQLAGNAWLQQGIVFGTMVAMALPLRITHLKSGLAKPWGLGIALACNLLMVPALAAVAAPFLPESLGAGLLVTSAVPCTLASAAVLSRRAGGDVAVPLLTTLITNSLCFAYTPAALALLLPAAGHTSLDFWRMAMQLALLIVMPIALAQGLRWFRGIGTWADRRSGALGIASQVGILLMVTVSAVQMGLRWKTSGGSDELQPQILLLVVFAALTVHLLTLVIAWYAARFCGVSREQRIGVALAGSQKTLMVGLQLAVSPELSVSILPMIAYHVGQLVCDTMLTNRWKTSQNGTNPQSQG